MRKSDLDMHLVRLNNQDLDLSGGVLQEIAFIRFQDIIPRLAQDILYSFNFHQLLISQKAKSLLAVRERMHLTIKLTEYPARRGKYLLSQCEMPDCRVTTHHNSETNFKLSYTARNFN